GLRQVHLHEARDGTEAAVARARAGGWPARERPAEDLRHGVPGAVAAAVANDAGQRAAAAGDRRAVSRAVQGEAQGVRGARPRLARESRSRWLRGPVPLATVRRHAAAREHLSRTD